MQRKNLSSGNGFDYKVLSLEKECDLNERG